jgi:hypothetical protein
MPQQKMPNHVAPKTALTVQHSHWREPPTNDAQSPSRKVKGAAF